MVVSEKASKKAGSEMQASDGPTSKPAIGGGGEESHIEVRKPVGDGNALDAGDAGHGKASAAGDVENAEVVFELGYRLVGKNLGCGTYGSVFPVMWKNGSSEAGSELAVVKHIEHTEPAAGPSEDASREMDILMQLKHPHVIRLIQAMQTPFARDLIFEYCTCDLRVTMYSFCSRLNPLAWGVGLSLFFALLCSAMAHG